MLRGGGFLQIPQAVHFIGLRHRRVHGVEGDLIGGIAAQEVLVGGVDDGHRRVIGGVPPVFQDDVVHFLILFHPLRSGVPGGDGGGLVVVGQVSHHTAAAEDEQCSQQGHLLFLELQALFAVVGQLHPVGNGLHKGQENGQHHRLNGEHEQILQNPGNGEHIALIPQNHLIVQHHNGGLEQNVHEQADAEPAEDHPGGGDLGPVQEQGKDQGAGNFRQHEGREIGITLEHDPQHVGDDGGQGSHHRAVDHGPQSVGQESGVDVQVGRNGYGNEFQGHPQGNHQGGEHQHFGVLQLCGGVPPVGGRERGFVQGCGLLQG